MITGGTPIGNLHLPTSGDQLSGTFRLLPVHIPHRVLQEALSCVLGECLDWERQGLVTWGYMLWEKGIIEGNIRVNRFSWIYWMCPKITDILYTSILMGNWWLYKIWMELGYPNLSDKPAWCQNRIKTSVESESDFALDRIMSDQICKGEILSYKITVWDESQIKSLCKRKHAQLFSPCDAYSPFAVM